MQTKRLYREGKRVGGEHSLSSLAEHRASEGCTAWVDLTLDEEGALDELARLLDLHALAVEDARSRLERPRLARFDSHLLLTLSSSACGETGDVTISRLTAFILPGILVTVHEPAFPIEDVTKRLDENEELSEFGVPWLVWGLLDVVVDSHTDSVEQLDEVIEALSDGLFSDRPDTSEVQRRAFTLRRSVSKLRHATLPSERSSPSSSTRARRRSHPSCTPTLPTSATTPRSPPTGPRRSRNTSRRPSRRASHCRATR